jgi:hypothetical protein
MEPAIPAMYVALFANKIKVFSFPSPLVLVVVVVCAYRPPFTSPANEPIESKPP